MTCSALVCDTKTLRWLQTQVVVREDGVAFDAHAERNRAWVDIDPDGRHFGLIIEPADGSAFSGETPDDAHALVAWANQIVSGPERFLVLMQLPISLLRELDTVQISDEEAEDISELGRELVDICRESRERGEEPPPETAESVDFWRIHGRHSGIGAVMTLVTALSFGEEVAYVVVDDVLLSAAELPFSEADQALVEGLRVAACEHRCALWIQRPSGPTPWRIYAVTRGDGYPHALAEASGDTLDEAADAFAVEMSRR